jgi:hypothetical protein
MLEIKIFGKLKCSLCESTKKKVEFLLDKWGMKESVNVVFYNMESLAGLTEGAMLNATDIPTTIVTKDNVEVARWVKKVPESEELRSSLE